MLVLSRKVGECIVINDEITVTVLEVQGGRMKLGIKAPPSVPVHRSEIYDRLSAWEHQAPDASACCPQL